MRKLPYRVTQWKINLRESIAARVELRLSNISGTGPQYGARSKLIETLLSDWLELGEVEASKSVEGQGDSTSVAESRT